MIKINMEQALIRAARNEEVYMAVCLNEETPIGEFVMADFYFAPDPKEPPKEPKKKIDHGKICALRNAGWSITKIADEMGCSGPTVRAHLDKEGIK